MESCTIMDKLTIYKLNDNVDFIKKSPTELIVIDKKTGKKKKIKGKTNVEIILNFTLDDELIVENVAKNILKIDTHIVLSPLKELARIGFIKKMESEEEWEKKVYVNS